MDDVTDVVFREIVREIAAPDLFFTEFTNVEALSSAGRESQIKRLQFTPEQHPIIAQIWGLDPTHYAAVTKMIKEMGFDGVDINMGCPIRTVFNNGACSALIRDRKRAKEIITATKEAAGDMPVSVKTRIGVKEIETESWIGFLLEQDLAAITVHGRTVKELSKVPCHWDEIGKAVKLRNRMGKDTVIIGNGDVKNHAEAVEKFEQHHVDGVMIGRGIFTDILTFSKEMREPLTPEEQKALLLKHVQLFEKTWGTTKKFEIMKKFFKIYLTGFAGAQELRMKLMEAKNAAEIEQLLIESI